MVGILTGHKRLDGPGWEIEDDTGVVAWVQTKKEAQVIITLQRLPTKQKENQHD